MTEKEKAMAYDEAIKRAKELYSKDSIDNYSSVEYIFPELKKSESERISEEIITYLYNDLNNIKQLTPRTNQFESWLNWIKKQGEQKPTWSEEDEKICKNILECLRNGWKKLPTDILMYESWLKSLRPQNTWKPTKEQMCMFEWLTTNVLDDGVVGKKAKEVLNTLIEELKSL